MTLYFLLNKGWLFCGLLAVLFLSSCAPPQHHKQRFFWPLPVNGVEPKLEYIDFLLTDKNLQSNLQTNAFVKNILGEYPPVALFKSPYWITGISGQRIAVSDLTMRKVLILDLRTGEVRNLKDKQGVPYVFTGVMGVDSTEAGEVLVVDSVRGTILKFGVDEKLIDTYGGLSVLKSPIGIAVNDRDKLIYVSEIGSHKIAVFDMSGNLHFKFGMRGHQAGQFNYPTDVDVDEEGNVYVLDALNFRVQVFDATGHFMYEFGEQGTEAGSFRLPKGLAVSPQGQVYVTDTRAHKVVVFDHLGQYLLTFGAKSFALSGDGVTPGGFVSPRGIAVDAAGSILVVDGMNKMVHRFQYLTADYLKAHPVSVEDVYVPPSMSRQLLSPIAPVVDQKEPSDD
jgi:sugar lactone lactonase YvrE